jgi:hypothetical protein
MKPRLFLPLFLLLLAAVVLRVAAEQTQLDPSSNPRFIQSRTRIDALFHYRNSPQPTPDPRQNPFRMANDTSGAQVTPGGAAAPIAPGVAPDSDEGMLQLGASTLKIGGYVVKEGSAQIGINSGLYKEGDVIPARVRGVLVYFRIRHITPDSVTISLNDAELTVATHK